VSHKYVDCPVGSYHHASPENAEERAWVEKNDAARILWVFGERSTEYSKAIGFAFARHLTYTQVAELLGAGVMRSDEEIEAFDAMEKGHEATVLYSAGEVERA
jgi:hypothetical protein